MLSEPVHLPKTNGKQSAPHPLTSLDSTPAREPPAPTANGGHSSAHGVPLTAVLDSRSRFKEYDVNEPDAAGLSDYRQPRWEEGKGSVQAQRGSVPSSFNDPNLVLTAQEQRGGLVIKKFREFQRVAPDADVKSVSNRSVTSESARPNSIQFRPFRLAEGVSELGDISAIKEVPRQLDEVKSERAGGFDEVSNFNESQALTEHRVNKQLLFDPSEVDALEVRSDRFIGKPTPKDSAPATPLPALPEIPDRRDPVSAHDLEGLPKLEITDRERASSMLQGEIAEVVLSLESVGRFEGDLVDGRMNGYGRLFDSSGRLLFEGDFVDDVFEGVGVLYNHHLGSQAEIFEASVLNRPQINLDFIKRGWDRYEGLFRGGRFHGRGYLFYGGKYVIFSRFTAGEIESGCVLKDLSKGTTKRLDIYGPELIPRTN